jgi:hypothetical protein
VREAMTSRELMAQMIDEPMVGRLGDLTRSGLARLGRRVGREPYPQVCELAAACS